MAQPLTSLLKKEQNGIFLWNREAQEAFDSLKKAVSSSPVLSMPHFQLPFVIECDASGIAVGAVLTQEGQPLLSLANQW